MKNRFLRVGRWDLISMDVNIMLTIQRRVPPGRDHPLLLFLLDGKCVVIHVEEFVPFIVVLQNMCLGLLCWSQYQNHYVAETNRWHDCGSRTVAKRKRAGSSPVGTAVPNTGKINIKCNIFFSKINSQPLMILWDRYLKVGRRDQTLAVVVCTL